MGAPKGVLKGASPKGLWRALRIEGDYLMLKLRVLTGVSVVALATAFGVSGAKADNLIIDLTALPPTIEVAAGSSASALANEQSNEDTVIPATAGNIVIGLPLVTGASHDLGGGVDTILVDQENAVFALAIGNQEIASIDFFVADNGGVLGDDAAATNGSLQYNLNNDVTSLVDNADILADVVDLGAGSAVTVSDNNMRADGIGNDADVSVTGNVNQLQVSDEFGQADITTGSPTLSAGATALSGSVQANLGTQQMSALVSDSRIGLLARVDDDTTAIVGVPLDIVGNLIAASFVGNSASTLVDLGADEAVSLVGTAGAANVQINQGDFNITAEVRDVTIEAGDTVAYLGTEYISDLQGSTLTLTDSEISASATSNTATNTVKLADNLSQDGVAGPGDQLNTVDFGAVDSASVNGDLFVANGQYSAVGIVATVDLLNRDSTINVLTEDVAGSTILADDNLITAAATGSAVVNTIEVGNATDFNSLVGINSVQYTEGTQTATNESLITVDLASTAPNSAGDITNSSITVDSNEESAEAIGNSHSSAIDIKGTTVTGPSDADSDLIVANRDLTVGEVDADWSILSAQVLDGGSASASLTTGIDVDAADIEFSTASLSVSDNDIHGLAIGNLSTEASISIDAVTIDGSIGVVNSQTVEDSALLSSVVTASAGVFIDVDVAAGNGVDPITVVNAAIDADNNSFTSRVWGNLADSTTNSINVKGVTVGDADIPFTDVFVDRDTNPVTTVDINGGYALLNDQSVEDLNTATVTATISGDLINITVGDDTDPASSVTNSDISADGNKATTSATLNQATSSITIDAVTTSAGAALANVQTLTDEDGVDGSAEMLVSQTDLDITIDVIAGDEALSDLNVTANDNSMMASARVNLATNTFKVDAQTQIVDDVFHSGVNQISVDLDTTPFTRGANLLVNDQAFLNLGVDGVVVNITDNDITIDLSVADDDVENSTVQVNGNTVNALAAGNDAANTMELNIGTFDLTNTDEQGNVASNGPIANLVSNQWGLGGDTAGGFTTNVTDTTIAIDANTTGGDTADVEDSQLNADGNTVRALSRANNVANTLSAKGTTLENDAPDNPGAFVSEDGQIVYNETSITLASRQVNSVDISSNVAGTTISVEAGSPFGGNGAIDDDITASSLTANSNLVVSEARGSDGANLLALDFTQNEGQAYLTNLQYADEDVSYVASTTGTEISVLSNVGGELVDSALSASGNAVASLASANRATNVLNSSGTNVDLRNGNNVVTFDPLAAGNIPVVGADAPISTDGHLALINVQGDPGNVAAVSTVSASTTGTLIGVISEGLVESGSIRADNNLVLAEATQHKASNTLNITASANIDQVGTNDNTPGASVVSLQTIFDGDLTEASVGFTGITAYGEDPRSGGSFAASASKNQIVASAIGATALNSLIATAGASIDVGAGGSSPITGGTDPTVQLDAGFNVLNVQLGEGATMDADVVGALIFAGGAEDYNNDAVTVSDNLVRAEARGFVSQNLLVVDAGASSNAMGAVANVQQLDTSVVNSDVFGVAILTGNLDEGAINSSLTVEGNAVEAIASGNRSTNAIVAEAGATLQESSGAGVTIDPAGVSRLSVTGADYAVLNDQSTSGTTITADVNFVGITIDGLNAVTGVDQSSLGVEGNQVIASAVGNDTINSIVLNTGTFQHPSAAIANIQTNDGTTVSASVDGVVIGIGALATLDANSSNSSLRVRGNTIGATAIGNSAINVISSGD